MIETFNMVRKLDVDNQIQFKKTSGKQKGLQGRES